MKTVAIVDYGMGNVGSVARAIEMCGGTPVITSEAEDFARATHILLPGVGAFAEGMTQLRARGLDTILADQVIGQRVPFLGICLGMQLLATTGYEHGETPGLGWIAGEVVRLEPGDPACRVPHVGWNEVRANRPSPLFEGIAPDKDFYFVHSFHFCCGKDTDALATTPYGHRFVSAVQLDNIYGVQFHPEKSQKVGLHVLRNFLEL